MELPSYFESRKAVDLGSPTRLQQFIADWEPDGVINEVEWRKQLAALLSEWGQPIAPG